MNLNSIYELLGSIFIDSIVNKKINNCDGFQQDSHTITKIKGNFILHVIKGDDLGHIREVSRKWCKVKKMKLQALRRQYMSILIWKNKKRLKISSTELE
jgi:uncharacterized protein YabN with tetrapyrrole methylase and pyrophosphatase domain